VYQTITWPTFRASITYIRGSFKTREYMQWPSSLKGKQVRHYSSNFILYSLPYSRLPAAGAHCKWQANFAFAVACQIYCKRNYLGIALLFIQGRTNSFFFVYVYKIVGSIQHKTAAYKFPFSRSFFRNKMNIFFFLVVLPFIFCLFTSSPRETSPSFFAAIFGFNVDCVSKGESQWKS
jgi:hypothetical protein